MSVVSTVSLHQCKLGIGGFYNPLALKASWLRIALHVTDLQQQHTTTVKVEGNSVGWIRNILLCLNYPLIHYIVHHVVCHPFCSALQKSQL